MLSVQKSWSLTSYNGKTAKDGSVTTETAMTDSYSYKLDAFGVDPTSGEPTAASITALEALLAPTMLAVTSIMHFTGEKGDEIAWYTKNYNTKKDASDAYIGSVQKSWRLTSYDGKTAKDNSVTTEDAMTDSYSYKLDAFTMTPPSKRTTAPTCWASPR